MCIYNYLCVTSKVYIHGNTKGSTMKLYIFKLENPFFFNLFYFKSMEVILKWRNQDQQYPRCRNVFWQWKRGS